MALLEEIYNEKFDGPLYHYTSQEGLIGILENKCIWASRIQYLNDQEEFNYAVNLLRYDLQDRYGDVPESAGYDDAIGSFLDILDQIQVSNIFVSSFSENPDQLSQWRGYTSIGRGYTIGFHHKTLTKHLNQNGRIFKLVKCLYDRDKQDQLITEFIHKTSIPSKSDDDYKDKILRILSNFAEIAPILKHPSFKEEKEWRLISPLINSFNDNVKFRTGKSMIIPYIEFSLADENNKIDFEEIIIGPTPHLELSKMSTQLLLVKSGFDENDSKKVKISEIPYRDW